MQNVIWGISNAESFSFSFALRDFQIVIVFTFLALCIQELRIDVDISGPHKSPVLYRNKLKERKVLQFFVAIPGKQRFKVESLNSSVCEFKLKKIIVLNSYTDNIRRFRMWKIR